MLFLNPLTRRVEYLDDQTGIISSIIPEGKSSSNPSIELENPALLQEAMFRVLLTLSSTLFSSMIIWTASPEEKEKSYNDEREDHKQSKTWEELIEKVGKMINKDEEISNMALGDLLVGLVGWVEGVIITTWGKTIGDIRSSALEIIKGAPKRVVDLVMLEMELSQSEEV